MFMCNSELTLSYTISCIAEIPKLELVPPSEVINLDVKSSYKVECKNGDVSNLRWLGPDGRDISVHSGDKLVIIFCRKFTVFGNFPLPIARRMKNVLLFFFMIL